MTSIPTFWHRALGVIGGAGFAAFCAFGFASAAEARSEIAPYLEIEQIFETELSGSNNDVLTYTAVAAGIDGRVSARRTQVQVSYRYERRFSWEDDLSDEDVHSGLAMAHVQATEALSVDAGAIATRARADSRGPAFGFRTADDGNIAQVYGIYAGPTLATHAGEVAVNAAYRIGYVKVDDDSFGSFPGGPLDNYDSSISHNVTASIGMAPGDLPFGWTVSAGYDREDVDQLDQKWEGKYVRGDVVVPLSPTFAVTGGVGYEKLEASQDDFLRDSGGVPVVTPDGDIIADPSKPRLLTYDESGIIWDAGVIWRPSPRTELQARVGRRYGGTTYLGTLQYQLNEDFGLSVVVYDAVTSFGRLLISDIKGLPKDFKIDFRGLNGGVGGCVFGKAPGSGSCFDNALQSINTANFRNRGVGILFSGERGRWEMELGLGYARRKYLAADDLFVLDGIVEESVTIEGSVGRNLSRRSSIEFDAYAAWYDSGIRGNDNVFSTGLAVTYYRTFLDRLEGQGALGIYRTEAGDLESTVASALLGLRYNF